MVAAIDFYSYLSSHSGPESPRLSISISVHSQINRPLHGSVPTEAGSCRCSGAGAPQELLQEQKQQKFKDSVFSRSTVASANTRAPVVTGATNQVY